MKPKIAIVMAHGHATKWLQTSVYSMKKHRNEQVDPDIFIMATWPDHPSLKALTETGLGENVTIIPCEILWIHGEQFSVPLGSHATALDECLDFLLKDGSYRYMFTAETDCKACKDGWLDWFYNFLEDDGMVGFFWEEGKNHYNINPSGTLYSMDMLAEYHEEVRENDSDIVYHYEGNKVLADVQHGPKLGLFSEVRGIKDPTNEQLVAIKKGIPHAGWYEPGAYLYYRALGEYETIAVPCDHLFKSWADKHLAPSGTYYGGQNNPYYVHYWGGTRAWDDLKHIVEDPFVKDSAPHWKEREHQLWLHNVPEKHRAIVYEIERELGI